MIFFFGDPCEDCLRKCLQYGPQGFHYSILEGCLEECHKNCKGKDLGDLERKLLDAAKSSGYHKQYRSRKELENEVRYAVLSYCMNYEESRCHRQAQY
ncbi:hypothetical protein IPA_07395 [Ignicoccus pacificus DSM 13166]|uniref:Uncharacterized protein n=1 Tax=Ignicoccus pacificus DSM 13166 TaxID=940294 RepID=A0A977KBQ1_9CREN|nr:hypothetical protein IPA_07395 [Ignicoccus pacificus DSM 13166]